MLIALHCQMDDAYFSRSSQAVFKHLQHARCCWTRMWQHVSHQHVNDLKCNSDWCSRHVTVHRCALAQPAMLKTICWAMQLTAGLSLLQDVIQGGGVGEIAPRKGHCKAIQEAEYS